MKFTTICIGKNKIELFNSIWGKETVKVNDEVVSSRLSFTGTNHIFKIKEDEKEVEYKLSTGFCIDGFLTDLYKDGEPVITSDKDSYFRIINLAVVIVIVAWLIGGFDSKRVSKGYNDAMKQMYPKAQRPSYRFHD